MNERFLDWDLDFVDRLVHSPCRTLPPPLVASVGSETESRVASVNYLAARAFSPLSRSLTHVRAQLSPPVSRVSSVLRAARLYALISTFTAAKVQRKKATKNTRKARNPLTTHCSAEEPNGNRPHVPGAGCAPSPKGARGADAAPKAKAAPRSAACSAVRAAGGCSSW